MRKQMAAGALASLALLCATDLAAQNEGAAAGKLPEFEVATIKPSMSGMTGLYTYPGGRIFCGFCTLRLMVAHAFDLPELQVTGGPGWIGTLRYDVAAIPPEGSPARQLRPSSIKAPPSQNQREMLQSLLMDRFHLRFHRQIRSGTVLWLVRTKKTFGGSPAKNPRAVPFMSVIMHSDREGDGEMMGANTSLSYMAQQLSEMLGIPVVDKTGLAGSFDFDVPAPQPANADRTNSTLEGLNRLGLKLVRKKGPIDFIMIESATTPSSN